MPAIYHDFMIDLWSDTICITIISIIDYVVLASSVGRRTGLRSADTFTLDVPRNRLSFGDGAFCVAGRTHGSQSSFMYMFALPSH